MRKEVNIRRLITAATLCGILFFVTGCISYKQHTTLESDGSGRIVLDAWVDYFGGDEEGCQEAEEKAQSEISEEMGPAFAGL